MAQDPFKELKEMPYEVFAAPKPYSFDLNEDMIKLIRDEFNAEGIAAKLAEAISGKAPAEIEKIGKQIFDEYGQNWIRRAIQLGEEYSDRTIEMVLETLDHNGEQFLFFPHVPQRILEIANLSIQRFLHLPLTLNNQYALAYQIPQCQVFGQIKEKCGDEVANLMTCKNACLKAIETLYQDLELDVVSEMVASTAKEGYCEFSMKKL